MDYKKLTKAQLVQLITQVQTVLRPAIDQAQTAANGYSTDPNAKSAFAFGHLIGSVKTANGVMDGFHK